jgi:hypothetical protein
MNIQTLTRFNDVLRTKSSFSCVYCGGCLRKFTARNDWDLRLYHKKCYKEHCFRWGFENWKKSNGGKPTGNNYYDSVMGLCPSYYYPEPLFTIMKAQINNIKKLNNLKKHQKKEKKELKKKIKAFVDAREEELNLVVAQDLDDAEEPI